MKRVGESRNEKKEVFGMEKGYSWKREIIFLLVFSEDMEGQGNKPKLSHCTENY